MQGGAVRPSLVGVKAAGGVQGVQVPRRESIRSTEQVQPRAGGEGGEHL